MLYLVYHLKSIVSDFIGKKNTESCLSNIHVFIHLTVSLLSYNQTYHVQLVGDNIRRKRLKTRKIVSGVGLLCIPFLVFAGNFLTGEQITKAFAGKTVQWEHMIKNKSGKTYFAEDGTLISSKHNGKWHVDGDKLCVSWGNCLTIESDGNGGFYKVIGGSKQVVHIKSLSYGNTL